MQKLCVTCGDINGIGPEIVVKTFSKIYEPSKRKIVYFCPVNIFENAASDFKADFKYQIVKKLDPQNFNSDKITIVDLGKAVQTLGKPSAKAGVFAFQSINSAYQTLIQYSADAIITAPLSKTSLMLAGIDYPGQTEIFADLCRSKNYMMVFLSKKMICGLVTIHESIRKVSGLITDSRITKALKVLENVLRNDLGIKTPKIAVLGLNPHAGENGKIGKEEIDIIEPAIKNFRSENIFGPFVPDAFFAMKKYMNYDAVLGMYHDQLLIPFKMMNFNSGVNYTAGLPVIRTSPDHGTAYDIAGKGIADSKSMIEAVYWAEKISNLRKKNADR